ncbi:MAG: hypothetical protein EOO73_10600 [Myxococcales bacterium]|nr:MAG: hypothetical protein EOO73_10600 [Myxococcales bacterium]
MTNASAPASRLLSSIPASPGHVAAVQRLLGHIDDMPPGATGALHFGEHGVILLQARKICWAVARTMRIRLTDILRNQTTPPVPREHVEQIYRRCKENGTPIGEALVASGLASEAGLRAALFKHNGEAIVALAGSSALPDEFVAHSKTGYDPKYSFAACEVLAMLGSLDDLARGAAAQLELASMLVPDSVGAAFVRGAAASGAMVIAVSSGCDFPIRDLLGVCNWASGLFDLANTVDSEIFCARASWRGNAGLVTWRDRDVGYIGLCSSRAAAARLVSRMSERSGRTSGVLPRGSSGAGEPA